MKKNKHSKIINIVVFTLICHLVFIALLELVALIPRKSVEKNIIESHKILEQEGLYIRFPLNHSNYWDNYTVAYMYNIMHAQKEFTITSFIPNYLTRKDLNGRPIDQLGEQIKYDEPDSTYNRHWMGSLVFFRPLSIFFNITHIRIILFLVNTLLLLYSSILFYKKTDFLDTAIYVFAVIGSGYYLNSLCLVSCWEYLVTMTSIILILKLLRSKEDYENKENLIFLGVGFITAYFTWLTYPLMVLGFSLLIFYRVKLQQYVYKAKDLFFNFIKVSLMWCIGYIFTTEVKSLFSIALNIESTAEETIFRQIGDASIFGRLKNILIIFVKFLHPYEFILIFTAIIFIICFAILKMKIIVNIQKQAASFTLNFNYNYVFVMVLIACTPFVWDFIFNFHLNHSNEAILYSIPTFAGLLILKHLLFKFDITKNRKGV